MLSYSLSSVPNMHVTFPSRVFLDFVTRSFRRSIWGCTTATRNYKHRRTRGTVVHHPANHWGRLFGYFGFFQTRVSAAWRKKTVSSFRLQQIGMYTRMRFTRTSNIRYVVWMNDFKFVQTKGFEIVKLSFEPTVWSFALGSSLDFVVNKNDVCNMFVYFCNDVLFLIKYVFLKIIKIKQNDLYFNF